MSQGRRHFTDEFKREAVALLVSSGRPLSRIASELGVSPSMLRNWRNGSGGREAGSARHPIPASAPHSAPDPAAEISRLRRENDRLRTERDILNFAFPQTEGERPSDLDRMLKFGNALTRLAADDPAVHKLTVEVRHLMKPRSALRDPDLVGRVEDIMAEM